MKIKLYTFAITYVEIYIHLYIQRHQHYFITHYIDFQ